MAITERARETKVDDARRAWINKLTDLSQRNNLLYFRQLKVGTLDLTGAEPDALTELFAGKSIGLHRLLPDADRIQIAAQAAAIARKAKENSEERGLETLFLAVGMASWRGEEGKRPPEAAILLLPISLDERNRSGPTLKRSGDMEVNPVLLHILADEFRCAISNEELVEAAKIGHEDDEEQFFFDGLAERLAAAAVGVPEFKTRRCLWLGNFSFQKMAMVRDLRELALQRYRRHGGMQLGSRSTRMPSFRNCLRRDLSCERRAAALWC